MKLDALTSREYFSISSLQKTDLQMMDEQLEDQAVRISGFVQNVCLLYPEKQVEFVLVNGMYSVQCVCRIPSLQASIRALSDGSRLSLEGVVCLPCSPISGVTQQEVEIVVKKVLAATVYTDFFLHPKDFLNEFDKANQLMELLGLTERQLCEIKNMLQPSVVAKLSIGSQIVPLLVDLLQVNGFVSGDVNSQLRGVTSIVQTSSCIYRTWVRLGLAYNLSVQSPKQFGLCPRSTINPFMINIEMMIRESYFELMDFVEDLFLLLFKNLKNRCSREFGFLVKLFGMHPLKLSEPTLRLSFAEACEILQEPYLNQDPVCGLSVASQIKLCQLVDERYGTDFFMVYRLPLETHSFFTMPCEEFSCYGNYFDGFLRGTKIIWGGERINGQQQLINVANEWGVSEVSLRRDIDFNNWLNGYRHGGFYLKLDGILGLIIKRGVSSLDRF